MGVMLLPYVLPQREPGCPVTSFLPLPHAWTHWEHPDLTPGAAWCPHITSSHRRPCGCMDVTQCQRGTESAVTGPSAPQHPMEKCLWIQPMGGHLCTQGWVCIPMHAAPGPRVPTCTSPSPELHRAAPHVVVVVAVVVHLRAHSFRHPSPFPRRCPRCHGYHTAIPAVNILCRAQVRAGTGGCYTQAKCRKGSCGKRPQWGYCTHGTPAPQGLALGGHPDGFLPGCVRSGATVLPGRQS